MFGHVESERIYFEIERHSTDQYYGGHRLQKLLLHSVHKLPLVEITNVKLVKCQVDEKA